MPEPASIERTGEYALRGDYHRQLSPDWEFYPTYLAKMARVRRYLQGLPADARVLDAGCGEGVIVEEFRDRLAIEGIDPNYASPLVRQGSLLALPYEAASFDRVLCLDVLEHLTYEDQAVALGELRRVLAPGGELSPLVAAALGQAGRMIAEGADILDVGGESTRPGHARDQAQISRRETGCEIAASGAGPEQSPQPWPQQP